MQAPQQDAPDLVVTSLLEGRVVDDVASEPIQSVAEGLFDLFGEAGPALVAQLRKTGRVDLTVTLVAHPAGETVVASEREPFHPLDADELRIVHAALAAYVGGFGAVRRAGPRDITRANWLLTTLSASIARQDRGA